MKKFAIWAGVVLFVLGLGIATFWNVPTWRLYTVNWEPLAMTNAENYCTAVIGMSKTSFKPNDPAVDRCVADSPRDNTTPSIANSVMWACQGVIAGGFNGTTTMCLDIMEQGQLWMLKGGGLADARSWSDTHPRPVSTQEGVLPGSVRTNRGGDTESPPDLGLGE